MNVYSHLNITRNVVDASPAPWLFFQQFKLGAAHDNYVDTAWVRAAEPERGLPCNCSDVTILKNGQALPEEAQNIISHAGPSW